MQIDMRYCLNLLRFDANENHYNIARDAYWASVECEQVEAMFEAACNLFRYANTMKTENEYQDVYSQAVNLQNIATSTYVVNPEKVFTY
jgi:hypothetical protein